ncbi:hypothetical protein KCU93_g307, partial [Aureobasidium melanogenum]
MTSLPSRETSTFIFEWYRTRFLVIHLLPSFDWFIRFSHSFGSGGRRYGCIILVSPKVVSGPLFRQRLLVWLLTLNSQIAAMARGSGCLRKLSCCRHARRGEIRQQHAGGQGWSVKPSLESSVTIATPATASHMNHAVASPLTNQVGATGRGGPLGWRQSGKHHHRSSLKVLACYLSTNCNTNIGYNARFNLASTHGKMSYVIQPSLKRHK